ncbi:MAG: polysaccharide deacetylase family protein [Emergencia sp.]
MAKKFLSFFLLCLLVCVTVCEHGIPARSAAAAASGESESIRWVDFDVSYEALRDASALDTETWEQDLHIGWVQSLAYLGTKYGGDFSRYAKADLDDYACSLQSGKTTEELTQNMKYYPYYEQAYGAVIGGLLGLRSDGTYGLAAYSPVGAGYWYTDSDDFGNGRSYGFARKHLGHDMFCSVGTPVIAVESGRVEALGWNQYGGWRIGIRSLDGLRYFYYAHLRKDAPFAEGLKQGDMVSAGQLIGYTGQTGYSIKENVNNINVPHLHFGMQLVFDESQKECNSEIWIDTYALVRLLSSSRSDGRTGQDATPAAGNLPAQSQTACVPIIMYHGLTDSQSRVNDYFITVQSFEEDMRYLKEHGYTSVTMQQLIDFVYDRDGSVTLPEKPVVITFDDGYCNNYRFATPILKKYGMKAVISVIGSACEEASTAEYRAEAYCNVTWDQLREMSDSGIWEIQNHTWNLHELKNGRKGASRKANESTKTYENILKNDIEKLQAKLLETTGISPTTFTWPYGAYSEESRDLLKSMGFKATLSCRDGINILQKGDTECLYLLKRNIKNSKKSLENILQN